MNIRNLTTILLVGITSMLCGCGSGGGSTSFGIYTYTGSGAWQNAIVNGYATDGTYSCNPTTDDSCSLSFSGLSTGSLGYASYSTDALPATWNLAAEADATCPSGASNWGTVSTGNYISLTCGSISAQGATVSPTSCTVVYLNGNLQSSCSIPYLEITTTDPILPTTYAISADLYTAQASSEAEYGETASSTTQVSVPAPTQFGQTVVTVTDPNTNETLAAVSYSLHECFITTNEHGTTETCPY